MPFRVTVRVKVMYHHFSVPYHPASNKVMERAMQIFKHGMKAGSLTDRITRVLFLLKNHSILDAAPNAPINVKPHPTPLGIVLGLSRGIACTTCPRGGVIWQPCVFNRRTCSDLLRLDTDLLVHYLDPVATMAKTVLVSLDERNRPVTFSGTKKNLLEDFRVVFQDQLAHEDDVYLQIKDESWGGGFLLMF